MTLPEELKKAEKHISDLQVKISTKYPTSGLPPAFWLPSQVVASFLERLEKELEETYVACNDERVWEIQARIGRLGMKLVVLGREEHKNGGNGK